MKRGLILIFCLFGMSACGGSSSNNRGSLSEILNANSQSSAIQDFEIIRESGGRLAPTSNLYYRTAIYVGDNLINVNQLQGSRNCNVQESLTASELQSLRNAFLRMNVCGQRSSEDAPAFDQAMAYMRWNRDEWDNGCQDVCDAIDEEKQNLNTIDFTGASWAQDRFRVCDTAPQVFQILKSKLEQSLRDANCPLSFDFMINPLIEVGEQH